MWSGPEHSSLNTGVKSSQQPLNYVPEQFQSPLVNHYLFTEVTPVNSAYVIVLNNNFILVTRSGETVVDISSDKLFLSHVTKDDLQSCSLKYLQRNDCPKCKSTSYFGIQYQPSKHVGFSSL